MRARVRLLVGAMLVGITAAANVVAAGPASAATRVFTQRVVSETVRVDGLQHRGAYPTCADGEVATGGGFGVSGTTDPAAYTVLVSAPLDNGWNVQIYLAPGFGSVDLTGYVVCLKKVVGDPHVSKRVVTVESKAFRDRSAVMYPKCGKGEIATGGGYTVASINPTAYTVYLNEPLTSNGWNVQVLATHDPYVYVWGYAVCVKVPDDVRVSSRVVTRTGAAYGQVRAGLASYCDKVTEVATGGGYAVGSRNPYTYTVSGSRPGGAAWRTETFYDGDPANHLSLWSSVVCVRNTR